MRVIKNVKKILRYFVDLLQSNKTGIARAGFSIISTRFLNFACNLLSGVLLARILQPEGKGEYTIFLLLPLMLSNAGNLGLGTPIIHFSAKDPSTRSSLNANSFIFSFSLSLFYTSALLFFYYFKLLEPFGDFQIKHILLMAIVLPSLLFRAYSKALLHGNNYISARNLLVFSESFIYLMFLVILALLGYLSVWYALCSWVGTILITELINIKFLLSFNLFSLKADIKLLIRCIKMGLKTFLVQFFGFIILQSDLLLIQYFIGSQATGIYSIASSMSLVLLSVPESIGLALFPYISKTENLNKVNGTEKVFFYCRITIIISLFISLAAIILAPFFLNLIYGYSYSDALYPFLILSLAVVFAGYPQTLNAHLYGRGTIWPAMVSSAVAATINLSLNLLLIPEYSIYGAAISSLIAYSFFGLSMSYFYCVIIKTPLKELIPSAEDLNLLCRYAKNEIRKVISRIQLFNSVS